MGVFFIRNLTFEYESVYIPATASDTWVRESAPAGVKGDARHRQGSACVREKKRGRSERFAVLIAAVGSLIAVQAGPAVAAGCPNEAFRLGPSAQLSGCRAYEMVSPLDKNGGNVGRVLQAKVSPDGNAVTFYSSAAFAGSASNALSTDYLAKRGGSDWGTETLIRRRRAPATAC